MRPASSGEAESTFALSPTPWSWRLALAGGVVLLAGLAYLTRHWIGLRGQSLVGMVCFGGVAAVFSINLRAVRWRPLASGLALQVILALVILVGGKEGPGYRFFDMLARGARMFLQFSNQGAEFVFGVLANPQKMGEIFGANNGFVFAMVALPTIIFVSSFFTMLYHVRILPWIVRLLAIVVKRVMGTSGAETLAAVANVFMGQTEAPLVVKPYIEGMTRSELLAMMAGGMATVSGGMLAVYLELGAQPVALLVTCVLAAPCSLYLSKLVLPETETPQTGGTIRITAESPHRTVIEAIAGGASDGLRLALNVAAMLIAFLAFIALVNALLGSIHPDLSLKSIFAVVFGPVAFLMGVEQGDIAGVADLLGTKLVANEFLAYTRLRELYLDDFSDRSKMLATYALTGFANLSSIGIQIGGIGALAPSRRADLAQLGPRALLVGFLATLINASLAGALTP